MIIKEPLDIKHSPNVAIPNGGVIKTKPKLVITNPIFCIFCQNKGVINFLINLNF